MKSTFPSFALLAGASLALSPLRAASASQPNIIFILVDDLGKEWIPDFGGQRVSLPRIHELAQESMLFDRAYSMPQSTPSRVALMTGRYPHHNGWINHYDVPRWGHGAHFDFAQNGCFPKRLQQAGYKTCVAGKWQLNDFRLQPDAMTQAGFDEYFMWTGGEAGNEAVSENRYWDPYIHSKEGSRVYSGEFGPKLYTDFILQFIAQHKQDPFFIYYPMTLAHTPFVHTPHDMDAKTNYEKHMAMITYADYLIGRIVDEVKKQGLEEETYIFFATDNGTSGACVGMRNGSYVRGGKTLLSENGINCPFFVKVPGVNVATRSEALIDFTDIFPTMIDLAGGQVAEEDQVDGSSFTQVLHGGASEAEFALSLGGHPAEISAQDRVVNRVPFRDRAIIGKKYKVYVSQGRQIERVYCLQKDPFEAHNLINDSAVMQEVNTIFLPIIARFPTQDANPAYTRLKGPAAWDYDLNTMVKKQKKVRANYAPVSTLTDYQKFTKTAP